MPRISTDIQYPLALAEDASLVHIKDAIKGVHFVCPGCGAQFVVKQGESKAWHFAHKSMSAADVCSPETVLHKSAKASIVQTFNRAVAGDGLCRLITPCATCPSSRTFDLTRYLIRAEEEVSLFDGRVRADVAFFDQSQSPKLIIEIVVTHECDSATVELYQAANLPVFIVRPTLHNLSWGFRAIEAETLWAPRPKCPLCVRLGDSLGGVYSGARRWRTLYRNGIVAERGRVIASGHPMIHIERVKKERDVSALFASAGRAQEEWRLCSTSNLNHAACRWDDCLCYCHEATS